MASSDHRINRDQRNYEDSRRINGDYHPHPVVSTGQVATDRMNGHQIPGYTLMVAGRRTGKTSFLRLLLDTSIISPAASRDQLASVTKFIQASQGHTSHIRSLSVPIELANNNSEQREPLLLTLIDTPSLDSAVDASSRTVSEIMRHVEARFSDSLEDEYKARSGDHHVHLCIYFLDPDDVVPPSVSAPPVPAVPRARTNSLSKTEQESAMYEVPLNTSPHLGRPTLPVTDIGIIRRLSARVNVLPVVARADVLTNDRLAAVKIAIRRDLADAGIGFGIFDVEPIPQYSPQDLKPAKPHLDNGYSTHANGSSSTATSPPSTPTSPPLPRLPFALISPDNYAHSDGVSRSPPSRHELAQQYSPSHPNSPKNYPASRIFPGKFTRNYRWGSLDVMDGTHCDFVHIRAAIFHHMETLQKYTREYLLDKYSREYQLQHTLPTHSLPPRGQPPPPPSVSMSRLPPLSQASRPILAIDTAPSHMVNRHPSLAVSRPLNGEMIPKASGQAQGHAGMPELSPKTASSSRSRQRTKKITVACNFCRSRKLKCDGGRPACGQCFKRSNPCDYMVNSKRRGNHRSRRKRYEEGGSESEGVEAEGGDSGDPSGELEEPSQSPEVPSKPPSRRNSRVEVGMGEVVTLPPLNSTHMERRERDEPPPHLPPISQPPPPFGGSSSSAAAGGSSSAGGGGGVSREMERGFMNHELPPIATLPVPLSSGSGQDLMQTLPPLRVPADQHPTTRRRTSSASAKGSRTSTYGSKIVACNFCRARKTRCDGGHPACGSCARRFLQCNYVNDPSNGNPKGRPKTMGATSPQAGPSAPPSGRTSPVPPVPPPSGTVNGYIRQIDSVDNGGGGDIDLKRNLDMEGNMPSSKKMRITDGIVSPLRVGSSSSGGGMSGSSSATAVVTSQIS